MLYCLIFELLPPRSRLVACGGAVRVVRGGRRVAAATSATGGVASERRAPFALTPPPAARAPSARLMRLPPLPLPDMTVTECQRRLLEPSAAEPPPPAPPTDSDVLLGRVLAGERPSADHDTCQVSPSTCAHVTVM
ncbi:hypothetical protein B5X24_HaOG205021 [Helicoverpa armigera]|nr:hypothetical protein B5X24_HaOG205021 [Helicoverpa armigera]